MNIRFVLEYNYDEMKFVMEVFADIPLSDNQMKKLIESYSHKMKKYKEKLKKYNDYLIKEKDKKIKQLRKLSKELGVKI